MKLKFFIAGLAIVAGLASAVSCQDLTKDLTDLKSKVASLESTVQALQSKIDAGAVITSVTPSNSGIKITLSNGNSYEITNGVNGKDGTNGKDGKDGKDGADGTPGSVVTIGDNGNWFIDGVDTGLAAQGEDGADGTPGAFFSPDPESDYFVMFVWDPEKEEYVAVPTEIPYIKPGTITAVYDPEQNCVVLYGVEGWIGGYAIGGGHSAEGITSIELLAGVLGDLAEVTEKENTFGPNDELVFTADKQVIRETSVVVKVTPASAVITKDDITLINSKGETYDKFEIVSVEPFDGVITKATTDFALWKVVISLSEYDKDEFEAACGRNVPGQRTAFAVKIGEAVTAYDVAFFHSVYAADDARLITSEPILVYEGDMPINIFGLKNRNNQPDYLWAASTKKVPTPAVAPVATGAGKNIGAIDNRTGLNPVKATVGQPIYIVTNTLSEQYKGIYAEVDYAQCLPADPSEAAAWKSYTITGVDELSTEGVLAITVASPAAEGDLIAFRVYAVNWDGTLADPDGIAFEAIFGEDSSTEWDTVDAVLTPVKNGDFGVTAAVAPINSSKLANAASWTFTMDNPLDPTFAVSLLGADKKAVAAGDWSKVKFLSVVPTGANYQAYVDEMPYAGTITIKDANDFVLATCPVTFTKSIENLATPAGFSFKEGMLENNNYTLYADANRTNDLGTGTLSGNYDFILWAQNNYNAAVTAKDEGAKAYYNYRLYNVEDIAFNLANLYKFSATADKANFTTTIDGHVQVVAYDQADYKGNKLPKATIVGDPTAAKSSRTEQETVAGDAATVLGNKIFDNKAHNVKVTYDWGKISTTIDEETGLPVASTKNTVTEVAKYTITFKTPASNNEWSWNWNVWDYATVLGQGTQATAPTHNARLVYNYNAAATGTLYAPVPAWTPTGTATWAADPFAADYTPNLYLAAANFLGYVIDNVPGHVCNIYGKSEKAAYTGNLVALLASYLYIPVDRAGLAKYGEDPAKNYKFVNLGSEDYYVANYPVANGEVNLTQKGGSVAPTVTVPQTLTIKAYDIYANLVTITLPVNIVPAP